MSRPKMTDEQKAAAKAAREAKAASIAENFPQAERVQDLPSLPDYIASRERDDVVLVRVTYPGAEPHVFQGRYSGVVVADGPLSAQWSDGTTE
jgi:hypothetical protein